MGSLDNKTAAVVISAVYGAIGSASIEAIVQVVKHAKRNQAYKPADVAKSAVVGAIVVPLHREVTLGLRQVLGLPVAR